MVNAWDLPLLQLNRDARPSVKIMQHRLRKQGVFQIEKISVHNLRFIRLILLMPLLFFINGISMINTYCPSKTSTSFCFWFFDNPGLCCHFNRKHFRYMSLKPCKNNNNKCVSFSVRHHILLACFYYLYWFIKQNIMTILSIFYDLYTILWFINDIGGQKRAVCSDLVWVVYGILKWRVRIMFTSRYGNWKKSESLKKRKNSKENKLDRRNKYWVCSKCKWWRRYIPDLVQYFVVHIVNWFIIYPFDWFHNYLYMYIYCHL